MENYLLSAPRYESMKYRRCGRSGILLPEIALGFWHNFGEGRDYDQCKAIVEYSFDNGITHFDLANNYGPPAGSAETMFGRIFKDSLSCHRDEIIITSKAGHDMWPGPYGEWGSRKSLMASIDQSLKRMQLDYVDIFYSHRPDPNTPLEETMQALVDIVRQGKALYVGISKYPADMAQKAYDYLREAKVPCLAYQGKYSWLNREPEDDILPQAKENGVGFVAFSSLAQGLLTGKYLNGIPDGSRMTVGKFLKKEMLTPKMMDKLNAFAKEAAENEMSMTQYALKWVLRQPEVSSVIVGASSLEQMKANISYIL